MTRQPLTVPLGSSPPSHGKFRPGRRVRLVRELPSLRADSEGIVRGISTSAGGIAYVVRFTALTRVIAEHDLAPSPT